MKTSFDLLILPLVMVNFISHHTVLARLVSSRIRERGDVPAERRFFGGYPTLPYAYPSLVRVMEQGQHIDGCSGVIIDKNYVLTSGVCVGLTKCYVYTVVAGSWSPFEMEHEQWRQATNVTIHPKFSQNGVAAQYDLAVLKLDRPFDLNDKVVVSKLPTTPVRDGIGRFVLLGYRKGVANELELPALSDAKCKGLSDTSFEKAFNGSFMMCLRDEEATNGISCRGWGSPLFQPMKKMAAAAGGHQLVGMGSYSISANHAFGCGFNNLASVYHELYFFREWIQAVMVMTSEGGGSDSSQ